MGVQATVQGGSLGPLIREIQAQSIVLVANEVLCLNNLIAVAWDDQDEVISITEQCHALPEQKADCYIVSILEISDSSSPHEDFPQGGGHSRSMSNI